jgi:hypothetical protein
MATKGDPMSADFGKYLDQARADREKRLEDERKDREREKQVEAERAEQLLGPLKAKVLPILERAKGELAKGGTVLSIDVHPTGKPISPSITFHLDDERDHKHGRPRVLKAEGELAVSLSIMGSPKGEEQRWLIADLTTDDIEGLLKQAISELVNRR